MLVMSVLKLIEVGDSLGVILPEEVLARMKVAEGDDVFVTEFANGITLTSYDPELQQQMKLGLEFMSEYRKTFKRLGK